MSPLKRYEALISLLGLFLMLGVLARSGYLYAKIEWLRGAPELMGGLVFLTPVIFALPFLKDKAFWQPWFKGFVLMVLLVFLALLALGCIGWGIYAYW